VNQNPYSAEYDRLGFGRIEIFTKPGSDKFRGQAMFNFSDESLNARNPFLTYRPPYQARLFNFSLSGPLSKKTSFTFDADRRNIDENAVVNATVLDSNFNPTPLTGAVVTPQVATSLTPKIDYQLSTNHTLSARYMYSRMTNENEGVGEFSLPERAYNTGSTQHTAQLTETAILGARAVNETRLQYRNAQNRLDGNNTTPTLDVQQSFTSGGNQVGQAKSTNESWEISNLTTFTRGAHVWKWGGRVRTGTLSDYSPTNFGGTYVFAGGIGEVTSLERYRRTELGLLQGLTPEQIRLSGGGASQFTLNAGNPYAAMRQTDVGLFLLDDWRLRQNLTLSYGLRYENQTNISDNLNFSPRLSVAWGVDQGRNRSAKTVLRAGFGIFYDRFDDNYTLQSLRYNGVNQVSYLVRNPDFYPLIPTTDQLAANMAPQTVRQIATDVRAPRIYQGSIGIERQLPKSSTVAVNYVWSRGIHMLRTVNINAPLSDGTYPLGSPGQVYQYESNGQMRQNQLVVNASTRGLKWITLFGFYTYGKAKGDTDGAGSFPSNTYDYSADYGRSMMDIRHRAFVGGSLNLPWKISMSPFMIVSSGRPFNILSGLDTNRDTIFNDRPSFAQTITAQTVNTQWGVFNPIPLPGETIIARNYGEGPGMFSLNLRVARTFGFGKKAESTSDPMMGGPPPGGPGGGRGPGGGPGGGGPPPMMMGGGRGGPPPGMFGGSSGRRYSLTVSASARNLFNTVNLGTPIGNLSSPQFGQSVALAGGFGPMGGASGSNRRIDLQLRFSF
jgi:hypothetical protein